MKKIAASIFKFLLISISAFIFACASQQNNEEIAKEIAQLEDELSEESFLEDSDETAEQNNQEAIDEAEDDFGEEEEEAFAEEEDDDFSEEEDLEEVAEEPQEEQQEEAPVEVAEEEIQEEAEPLTQEERDFRSAMEGAPLDIVDIKFQANNSGGTIAVETSAPSIFKTRMNPETNQLVLEVANANLPSSLTRPYILKEFRNTNFKQINAYQNDGSSIARVVVQMGTPMEPIVRGEGNTILILPKNMGKEMKVTQKSNMSDEDQKIKEMLGVTKFPSDVDNDNDSEWDVNVDYSKGGTPEAYINYKPNETTKSLLLSARTLDEFLLKHDQFYGKPISLQVKDAGVRDVLQLLGEEAGLNMVLADDIGGNITIKLRKVPWDQAFILVLKSKNLGYIREGSIIRIASLATLEAEKAAALQVLENRNNTEPLQVKILPVSYATPGDMATKIGPFLSPRGQTVVDDRTSSIIITDIEESILKAQKLIEVLDVPPYQVLIEGKVVEAIENYSNAFGINWQASGEEVVLSESGGAGGSGITLSPQLSIAPGGGGGIASLNLSIGTLEVLGNLDASIGLLEAQSLAKVISSPRIITLNRQGASFTQTLAIPYLTATVDGSGGAQPSVSFQSISLTLSVTPQVTNSGSVIMAVSVSRTTPTGSSAVGGASATTTSSANTNVIVKNNQSAVIGGIYSGSTTNSQNRVPVLADIPVLGWLFKNDGQENSKTELVIFITPRILEIEKENKPEVEEESA